MYPMLEEDISMKIARAFTSGGGCTLRHSPRMKAARLALSRPP